MIKFDLLIKNGIVITMQGKGTGIINSGTVGVTDDRITYVGDAKGLLETVTADRVIDATDKIIMPGLIDTHTHSHYGITRGLAQDIELWQERGIGPYLNNWTVEDRVAGSALHILEEIKHGTTTIMDFDIDMLQVAEIVQQSGMRARLATKVNELAEVQHLVDLNELYEFDVEHAVPSYEDSLCLLDKYGTSGENRISATLGLRGVDMITKETLLKIRDKAREYDAMINIHLADAPFEVEQCLKRNGMTPVEYLEDNDMLNERLIAAHMHHNTVEEQKRCAAAGVKMIFCPASIGVIDGLIPFAVDYLNYGGVVGIGSDQATGNNNASMFSDMKIGAILGKVQKEDPTVLPSWKILRMCTIEAAQTIGLEKYIGSLEVGKKADIIILDGKAPTLTPLLLDPVRNIVPNLVYAATGDEVETSIVDGQIIMENRDVRFLDENEVIENANFRAQDLAGRAYTELEEVEADFLKLKEYY